jgi:hypothetical protein
MGLGDTPKGRITGTAETFREDPVSWPLLNSELDI